MQAHLKFGQSWFSLELLETVKVQLFANFKMSIYVIFLLSGFEEEAKAPDLELRNRQWLQIWSLEIKNGSIFRDEI